MASVGDTIAGARWGQAFAPTVPQSTVQVTDLSDHVDGGMMRGTTNTNAAASKSDKTLLYWEAGIVLTALALLWLMGAVVFRTANN